MKSTLLPSGDPLNNFPILPIGRVLFYILAKPFEIDVVYPLKKVKK